MIEIFDPRTGELMDTDSVPGLAAVAAMLDEQIFQLFAVVAQIQEGLGDDGSAAAAGPFVWHSLDASEAARLWAGLADWVGWLRGRYPLARQIPLCWWRHPELVEELTALWLAWRDAYTGKDAPLTAAADWHGRWLPEFLRRVGAGGWNIACEGEHKERIKTLYDERRVDDEAAFADFVGLDLVADQAAGAEPGPSIVENGSGTVNDQDMQAALASGEARMIASFPGSPVAYRETFWMYDEGSWTAVSDNSTIAFLTDAERRMRLADEAVARAGEYDA